MRYLPALLLTLSQDVSGYGHLQLPLRTPGVAHGARTGVISAQFGGIFGSNQDGGAFGLDARQQRRMSEMKRADEPLVEELRGLSAIGVMSGLFLLPLIGVDRWLGVLLGWQFAPLLSIVEVRAQQPFRDDTPCSLAAHLQPCCRPTLQHIQGATGENCRKAGWEAHVRVQAARERIVKEWDTYDEKYSLRSRWTEFDARGKVISFSEKHDLKGRALALGALFIAKVYTPLKHYAKLLLAKLEEKGITPKARALW